MSFLIVPAIGFSSSLTMYRALYDFQASEPTALSFETSDQFTVMDTGDPYWWLVQNGYGQVGFVPANYLQQDEVGLSFAWTLSLTNPLSKSRAAWCPLS